jgi:hypothetical protein
MDNDNLTFSYDLPMNYNDEQIYQDIVNTVNGLTNNRRDPGRHRDGADVN